ncbi:glycoside hydrolase/phage tail family protein [Alsobacter sp. SYSU M60028]|uniref:Glycoside hydrolase/phage tail family protein n=1 Tax=Alsobacter ponti TaxID=2962936 RepID=A0ABT1L9Y4_9HYPH|nr:glycoside hydrolase/phage tail family protein [Alsobacter ponti]MCP8937776.1 glycoside hydrolase/phage tail family protein [Alsobacter ponti]
MTTLVLQAVGSFVGSALGGPVGSVIGQAVGAAAGAAIDSALLDAATPARRVQGPRLSAMAGLASTEGAPMPRVYGRARVGGQLIWATRFRESRKVTKSGGKGTGKVRATTWSYTANLAVGLCEGPIAFVRRVWADGRELDLSTLVMRVYRGDEAQEPDPLIVAKEGADAAPAYRGAAYVVFEDLPLADFGNRVPQLSFEVVKPVAGLAERIRAVCLIPGAGEFVYCEEPVFAADALGASRRLNRRQLTRSSDIAASLDALQALCPRLERVSLVVSWFGDDLRAGACRIAPRVETASAGAAGREWRGGGLARAQARVVSQVDGRPAFGGTPDDASVIALIRALKERGLAVTLYPFAMMDVPEGNALPDPWTGAASQPAYPWRGRVTCDPAPGRPGTPDATAAAGGQLAAFFGAVPASAFTVRGDRIDCASDEWSWRRLVLHCAHLAKAAGGVDALLIGSELVGLTRVRSAPGVYPAAAHLAALARDARAVLGPATRISYAADWTEYGAHAPTPGELRFPLDPLWASPDIDAVGVDAWWPLADWRDGPLHADAARARGVHDPAYLLANQAAGEGFDWYYADDADRAAQRRSPIADGAGKPWVWRVKDLVGWWSNPHVERVGGVELASPTAWTPQSKPIWLTETGCPAVDKGANGPNAFPDPKSSEGGLPPFSSGARDDLMQARAVAATLTRFDPAAPGHPAGANPLSPVYGGPMVDPSRVFVWAWDARPFPAFPALADVWADAPAWDVGHWLNGRLEGAPLDRLVAAILADFGAPQAAELALDGFVEGYVVDRPMTARAALEPLAALFGFDAVASGGRLRFAGRAARPVAALGPDDLVPDRDGATLRLSRAQASELPRALAVSFADGEGDYAIASAASRRVEGPSRRETSLEVAAVLPRAEAARLAEAALHEVWIGRETASFAVRPGLVALEVGDVVGLPLDQGERPFRITRIRDAGAREMEARAAWAGPAGGGARPASRPAGRGGPDVAGAPAVVAVDWPAGLANPPVLQSLAVAAEPWPGAMAVWRSADGASDTLLGLVDAPATVGVTCAPLPPGPLWRWDRAAVLDVRLSDDALAAAGDIDALAGVSAVAVRGPDGAWEAIAFARAELVGSRRWRLTRLLRGLGGSEPCAARAVPADSAVVLLDERLFPVATGPDALGRAWRYRVGAADAGTGGDAVTTLSAAAGPAALRPLAPVRAAARRTPAGVAISWLRRGRVDADSWEPLDIPLDEAAERYEVDILAGPALGAPVKRTLACDQPFALYETAAELADFGAAQAALTLRVAALSAVVGRGAALAATLAVANPSA